MKKFPRFIFLVLLVFSFINVANAFDLSDIFSNDGPEIHYCNDDDC
jgi:ABC-type sugar transport system permease subunit